MEFKRFLILEKNKLGYNEIRSFQSFAEKCRLEMMQDLRYVIETKVNEVETVYQGTSNRVWLTHSHNIDRWLLHVAPLSETAPVKSVEFKHGAEARNAFVAIMHYIATVINVAWQGF